MKPWYLRWWGIILIVFFGSFFLDIILISLLPLTRILVMSIGLIEVIFWVSLTLWLIRKSKKHEKDATIKEELLKNNSDKK